MRSQQPPCDRHYCPAYIENCECVARKLFFLWNQYVEKRKHDPEFFAQKCSEKKHKVYSQYPHPRTCKPSDICDTRSERKECKCGIIAARHPCYDAAGNGMYGKQQGKDERLGLADPQL